MSTDLVVTGGFGNGTLEGSIASLVLRGFASGSSTTDPVYPYCNNVELNRKEVIYPGDSGFDIPLHSCEDLTVMTDVDMVITRHRRRLVNTLSPGDYLSVGVGDDLVYKVRTGDFDQPGWYTLQVVAKRPGINVAFKPLVIKVKG